MTADYEAFRAEIAAWMQQHLRGEFESIRNCSGLGDAGYDPKLAKRWEQALARGGWVGIGWPKEHGGRALPLAQQVVFHEELVAAGAPVVANESLWSVGATVLSMVIGHISTQFVAANSIATVVWQFFWVAASGMANATAVVIGNAIGEGDSRELIQRKADTVTYLALGMGLLSGLLMLLIRPLAVQFFSVSEETKKLAMDLLVVRAILMVSQGATCQSIVGILRGGGDTRFAMFVDTFFLWTVAIPFGLCAGFLFKWSPPFVLLALRSDEIIKFLVTTVRIQRGKWIRDVTVAVSGCRESAEA